MTRVCNFGHYLKLKQSKTIRPFINGQNIAAFLRYEIYLKFIFNLNCPMDFVVHGK